MRVLFVTLAALVAFSSGAVAAPPQAPKLPQAPVIPACGCGCMETGSCKCKNCCERTADPAWVAALAKAASTATRSPAAVTAAPDQWVQVCDGKTCRWVKASAAPRSYSGAPVGDFIYDRDAAAAPSAGGGCATGNCGSGSSGAARTGWYPGKWLGHRR